MINLAFNTLLVLYLFAPFGIILQKKNLNNFIDFSKLLINCSIIICFICLSLNFFFSINKFITTLFLIIPIYIILKYRKVFFSFDYLKFILISSFLLFFLIVESNVYRPDAGLYHLPYIKILNEEKIIFGLSNLHFRYGHVSIIQYFSAFSNNLLFGSNGIVFAQGIIAVAVILNFLSHLYNYNKSKIYNLHFFYILFFSIYIFYKMIRYSEYGNDASAHFIFFFLVSEILRNKRFNIDDFLYWLIIAVFIALNKTTMLLSFLLLIPFVFKIKIKEILKNRKFYFCIIFFVLWMIKSLIVSGCLIYPIESSCLKNLSWTNIDKVIKVSSDSEVWAKAWPEYKSSIGNDEKTLSNEEYLQNFRWLSYWSVKHLKYIINLLTPYILFNLILFCLLRIIYRNKNYNTFSVDNINYKLLALLGISILIWFLKSPIYRYGYSYIISFISFIFAIIFYKNFSHLNLKKTTNILLALFFVIFFSKNSLRIFNNDNAYFNYPWPKYYSLKINNEVPKYKEYKLNNVKFYSPINGYCMYNRNLCTNYESILKEIKIYKKYDYMLIVHK